MTMTTTQIQRMLGEMRLAALSTDEIARRARIARGPLFRFLQGDTKALSDEFDKIASLYAQVIGKQPPPQAPPAGTR